MTHNQGLSAEYRIVVFAQPARGGKRKLLRTFRLADGRWEADDTQQSRRYQDDYLEWLVDAAVEVEPERHEAVKLILQSVGEVFAQMGYHVSVEVNGSTRTLHVDREPSADRDDKRLLLTKSEHPIAAEFVSGATEGVRFLAHEMQKSQDQQATRKIMDAGPTIGLGNTEVSRQVLDGILDVLHANGKHAVNISAIKTVRSQLGAAIERLASLPEETRGQYQKRVDALVANVVLTSSH